MQPPRALLLFLSLLLSCASTTPHRAASPDHQGHASHDWNEVYQSGRGFRLAPNALLAAAVEQVPPGKALDVGMGQGRNAVFLAKKGWDVTGVDTATEGVRLATEAAQAAHVKLDGVVGDISRFDLGQERYDLVTLLYVGGAELAPRIEKALKPHGLLVVEYFHHDMEATFHHSMGAFATGELERLFPTFEVLKSEVVDDVADFGLQPAKLVRFVARKR